MFGMKKCVSVDLIPAEHVFYLVRLHAPQDKVNHEHMAHFHKAIIDAGGFQSELEELLDIAEAFNVKPNID